MDLPVDSARPVPRTFAELEQHIVARAREFELSALLDLLASIGYDTSDIELRGHLSASPQPTMLHGIEILGPPARNVRTSTGPTQGPQEPKVVITVNLGLLSCRSPLPSYLLRLCEQLGTSDPLIELLRVLDRSLLHARLTSDLPDRTRPDWGDARRDFLRIHGLDSPLGLHWLFRHVFPELGVHVRRVTDDYRVPFDAARLNYSTLGRCAFGNTSRITVFELEVTLVSAESTLGRDPWPRIADRRIRRFVLPLLDEVCMNLTVSFLLLDRSSYARLIPTSYVGYDPMWQDLDAQDDCDTARQELAPTEPMGLPPARIMLYRGALPHTEPSTDELEQLRELVLATGDDGPLRAERPSGRPRITTGVTSGLTSGAIPRATPRGSEQELVLQCKPPESHHLHAYDVVVRWGARAWYADEPFEITVTYQGMPKANPDPRHHPNLWLWLRDEARAQLADVVAIEATLGEDDDRIGLELVERVIGHGDVEGLHALLWSSRTPQDKWDQAAWRRFLEWSEGAM